MEFNEQNQRIFFPQPNPFEIGDGVLWNIVIKTGIQNVWHCGENP
jgi:hypothetical protein